jgi:hypothetical protein
MLFPKPPQDAKRIKNVLVSSLRYDELMSICSGFGGPVQSVHSSFTYKHVASNSAGVTIYIHQASSTLELRTHPKCQAALSAKEVGPGLLLRPQIVDINARSRWVMSMR